MENLTFQNEDRTLRGNMRIHLPSDVASYLIIESSTKTLRQTTSERAK
jgi:hypothetical protein